MKYHYLAEHDQASVDLDILPLRYGGRRFVTEEEILSWFKGIDSTDDAARDRTRRPECDVLPDEFNVGEAKLSIDGEGNIYLKDCRYACPIVTTRDPHH